MINNKYFKCIFYVFLVYILAFIIVFLSAINPEPW